MLDFVNHALEALTRRGEAQRRPPLCGVGVGWRGLPLRTISGADSGFRRTICIHPRLRVSAGLRFAVILLSKTMDVGRDHLIHRKRSPFPYEGKALTRSQLRHNSHCPAPLLPIAYCLLPFKYRSICYPVPGYWSLVTLSPPHSSLLTPHSSL